MQGFGGAGELGLEGGDWLAVDVGLRKCMWSDCREVCEYGHDELVVPGVVC